MKPRTTKGFRDILKAKLLWGLILALVFTSVALAGGYRCTPCKQNYYCTGGVSYECPDNKVTFGTGAKSADECVTCSQRDGDSYPYYDEISGDCMACWQVPGTTTPYWDGTTCVACPSGKTWDESSLDCIESAPACAFTIPHNGGQLCLMESVDATVYGALAPQSAEEETTEFLSTYGIVNASSKYPDYWAGAMKYCQDKGLRLPTMDELVSIRNVVYGVSNTCTNACNNVNSQYVGAQTGCCTLLGVTVANQDLYNFLDANSNSSSIAIYSNAEETRKEYAFTYYLENFRQAGASSTGHGGVDINSRGAYALCVK